MIDEYTEDADDDLSSEELFAELHRIGWPREMTQNFMMGVNDPENVRLTAHSRNELHGLVDSSTISQLEKVCNEYRGADILDTSGRAPTREYLRRLQKALQKLDSVLDECTLNAFFAL